MEREGRISGIVVGEGGRGWQNNSECNMDERMFMRLY